MSCQPDQAGETTGARGATIGVETRVAKGTQAAAIDRANASSGEADARQLVEVSHEAPCIVAWYERRRGCRVLRKECIAYLWADLECGRPDRRPQPDQHFIGRDRQNVQRGLEHATSQPAPTGMCCGNSGSGTITEQYRQAVRSQHGTSLARRLAPTGIGSLAASRCGTDSNTRMHLLQPDRIAPEHFLKMLPIPGNRRRLVTDMIAQIETLDRRDTDTASPRGHTGMDACRGGPLGYEPILAPGAHPTKASRSCCSRVSNQTKSSGSGDSHFILCPVTG
jgi:hypothetical protein